MFFFKQKTAYEMRISDWSSDVCSSDLVKGWTHHDFYSLPVKPSPNLPNDQAVQLYPSLCLFEGTVISVGRGTQQPFLIIGNPSFEDLPFRDRKSVVKGKCVSVSVDLGVRRIFKNKKNTTK